MLRDLFLPLQRNGSDATALDAAVALALAQQAHLSALVTVENPLPLATEFGYVPVEVNQPLLDAARRSAEDLAARTRERLAREAIASEVRLSDSLLLWSEETAALQARHADLTVLGGPDPQATGPRFALNFKSLLLQSGRPLLLVPLGARLRLPLQKVVLAWVPTPEASRALHEALPLFAAKTQIDVLMIDPQVGEGRHGEQPGADIARHLARHGFEVRVVAQPRQGRRTGEAILAHAEAVDADLLVMGGYGHSRWREAVLGGTTRTVANTTTRPVLFSH